MTSLLLQRVRFGYGERGRLRWDLSNSSRLETKAIDYWGQIRGLYRIIQNFILEGDGLRLHKLVPNGMLSIKAASRTVRHSSLEQTQLVSITLYHTPWTGQSLQQ